MKSATTHPTPRPVVDAIQVIAAWLRVIEAVEALVSPEGGAAFHGERLTAKYLHAWGIAEAEIERLREENAALREIALNCAELRETARMIQEAIGR